MNSKIKADSLEKIVRAFYQISGMEISMMDKSVQSASIICRSQNENFCSLIHRSLACLEKCKESDVLHLDEAKKSKDATVYTCPFGIREAILPIIRDDAVSGELFCSMGIDGTVDTNDIVGRVLKLSPAFSEVELTASLEQMKKISAAEEVASLELLELIKSHAERCVPSSIETTLGQRVKGYIRNNPARKLTLADLSWNFHFSTVTLTQHFKSEFGITINEYIIKTRMKLAIKLLSESNAPLHEIALACGYQDVEYFSRSFKKYHGTPPGKWRDANRAKA